MLSKNNILKTSDDAKSNQKLWIKVDIDGKYTEQYVKYYLSQSQVFQKYVKTPIHKLPCCKKYGQQHIVIQNKDIDQENINESWKKLITHLTNRSTSYKYKFNSDPLPVPALEAFGPIKIEGYFFISCKKYNEQSIRHNNLSKPEYIRKSLAKTLHVHFKSDTSPTKYFTVIKNPKNGNDRDYWMVMMQQGYTYQQYKNALYENKNITGNTEIVEQLPSEYRREVQKALENMKYKKNKQIDRRCNTHNSDNRMGIKREMVDDSNIKSENINYRNETTIPFLGKNFRNNYNNNRNNSIRIKSEENSMSIKQEHLDIYNAMNISILGANIENNHNNINHHHHHHHHYNNSNYISPMRQRPNRMSQQYQTCNISIPNNNRHNNHQVGFSNNSNPNVMPQSIMQPVSVITATNNNNTNQRQQYTHQNSTNTRMSAPIFISNNNSNNNHPLYIHQNSISTQIPPPISISNNNHQTGLSSNLIQQPIIPLQLPTNLGIAPNHNNINQLYADQNRIRQQRLNNISIVNNDSNNNQSVSINNLTVPVKLNAVYIVCPAGDNNHENYNDISSHSGHNTQTMGSQIPRQHNFPSSSSYSSNSNSTNSNSNNNIIDGQQLPPPSTVSNKITNAANIEHKSNGLNGIDLLLEAVKQPEKEVKNNAIQTQPSNNVTNSNNYKKRNHHEIQFNQLNNDLNNDQDNTDTIKSPPKKRRKLPHIFKNKNSPTLFSEAPSTTNGQQSTQNTNTNVNNVLRP